MNRHLIVGRYGSKDKTLISSARDERLIQLNLISSKNKLNYGIGKALHYLWNIGIYPSEDGVDLLVLAAHIQAADTHILRSIDSQDSWTREIRAIIPVGNPDKWNATIPTLKRMLEFLSGDIWSIGFRKRSIDLKKIISNTLYLPISSPFDSLALFSGGLDSLIGAINLLEKKKNPLFISYSGEGPTSEAQQTCFSALQDYYGSKLERLRVWMNFPDIRVKRTELEKSTRSRSFLFFSIGVFAGTGLDSFVLLAPENGLIALNVPLDPLRLGSYSTRTTHPFYIAQWNELLKNLDIKGRIENPFWNKTKGEMILDCFNGRLLRKLVPKTLSCSSPSKARWLGHYSEQCGYCLPCLIRRAAIKKGFGQETDATKYSIKSLSGKTLNSSRAEGKLIRSFQFAINHLASNPNLAKILIHSSGPLSSESKIQLKGLADVYFRGMKEVEDILKTVRTK